MKKHAVLFVCFVFIACLTRAQQMSVHNSVKDINGNVYKTVRIGNQVWMDENLKATHYNTGTPIPEVKDNSEWVQLKTGAYCWYNNDLHYKNQYGALYNWYAIETGNVCPSGWHVPNDIEWTTLQNYLIANGYNYDGAVSENKIAKSLAAKNRWTSSSQTGAVGNKDFPRKRNVTGFSALPGGFRYFMDGTFNNIEDQGCFWSSTEDQLFPGSSWYRNFFYDNVIVDRQHLEKEDGFSIRCIKDIPEEAIDLKSGLVAYYPLLALFNTSPATVNMLKSATINDVFVSTVKNENSQQSLIESVEMYPNPAKGNLYFRNLNRDAIFSIYDLQGRKIMSGTNVNNPIDISALTAGTYIVQFEHNNISILKKLIKQ